MWKKTVCHNTKSTEASTEAKLLNLEGKPCFYKQIRYTGFKCNRFPDPTKYKYISKAKPCDQRKPTGTSAMNCRCGMTLRVYQKYSHSFS